MKTTLDELQSFVAIVDAGSLSAAAAQLEQNVSALSRALARLEGKLETTLLRRTTRRLELTEEGATFLDHARDIIASVEQAEEQLSNRRQRPSGRLRVDTATPFMLHVIAPRIPGYQARYPQVELELHSNERIVDLLERRIDIAIRIGPLKDSTLHARFLGNTRRQVLASPGYLARHGHPQTPRDLARHQLLGFTQTDRLNHWPLPDDDGQLLQIRPTLWSSSGETQRQLALADAGIVCLSDFMTGEDRRHGRLVPLLSDWILDIPQPINAVYYRNSSLSARILSFLDYLSETLDAQVFVS